MKKMLFVFNPRSGKEQIKGHLMEILDIFTRAGYEIRVHVTQKQSDAAEVVARYGNRVDVVVCSGGDGTLNETVTGMMKLKKLPMLGYIPAGSTNDFASSLEIPKRMPQAAADIVEGMPYAIDIGTFCHNRYFMYIAAFGAFTEVSYLTPQDKKNMLGHQAYMLESVRSLASLRSYFMEVEWDGNFLEGEFVFGVVTNTISVGGFKGLVGQDVELNDGYFEVLLIRKPKNPADISNLVAGLLQKEEKENDSDVRTFSCGICTSDQGRRFFRGSEFFHCKDTASAQYYYRAYDCCFWNQYAGAGSKHYGIFSRK